MFLPWIFVILAGVIAFVCGSTLDEGTAHPCIVFGKDIGGILYTMGMMGWIGVFALPIGLIALSAFYIFFRFWDWLSEVTPI